MKTSLLLLLALASLTHAASPALPLTQAALQRIDPEIKPEHYDIASTDLNNDGTDDVLALMNGRSAYYGSGGATMFILKGTSNGFESLGSIKVVTEPIYARKSVKNGFRDLLVSVRAAEPLQASPHLPSMEKPIPLPPAM